MEPIVTLYEHEPVGLTTLPSNLATYYGGGFALPEQVHSKRPYVIANFVETLDGVVSYNAPGITGGGFISGDNPQDKVVMGLLRASVDAVIFGSSSLRLDANHPRIPSFISPTFASEYDALRTLLGKKENVPISVVLSTDGHINFSDKMFHVPDLRIVIATTVQGRAYIAKQAVPERTEIRVIEANEHDAIKGKVSPEGVLALLARDYGVHTVLYEGGPTLLASFLDADLVDELFLTLAPQIAGRDVLQSRLALVEGHAFMPTNAPWATLLSVKLAGSHLLLRYRMTQS